MATKKISYVSLLKEAIAEYDAKAMDYRGPMTDPILTYDGGGELETKKDASSILERYYFLEDEETKIDVDTEPEYNEIKTGEEADAVEKTKDQLEDEIDGDGDELSEMNLFEDDEEGGDAEKESSKEKGKSSGDEAIDDMEPPKNLESATAEFENAILEKLIAELEVAEDPENEQAGTDKVPEKKAEELADAFNLFEDEGEDKEEDLKDKIEGEDEKDEGDLDIDKKIKKEQTSAGLLPARPGQKQKDDPIEEMFRIFTEQIEGEEDEDEKKKKEEEEVEEDLDLFLEDDDTAEEEEPEEGDSKEAIE